MRCKILAVTCLVLAIGLAACSSSSNNAATSTTLPTSNVTQAPVGPAQQPAPPQALNSVPISPQDGAFELVASGARFQQNFLRMDSGTSATIRVTNSDNVAHSLRLAGLDGRFDTDDDAVTNPAKIDPGGVGELIFAPQADGAYTFRCDFHPTTMGGQIIVGKATPGSASTTTNTPIASLPPGGSSESPSASAGP